MKTNDSVYEGSIDQVPVKIDTHPDLYYVIHGLIRKIINWLIWYPFITILAVFSWFGARFFSWSCPDANGIRLYSKTFKSLEYMYTFCDESQYGWLACWFTRFWRYWIINVSAIRNRLELVQDRLLGAIMHMAQSDTAIKSIRILGVACGSARGVLTVTAQLKQRGIRCEVTIIDAYRDSLNFYGDLAEKFGIADQITFKRCNPVKFMRDCQGGQFDVVEMVGILDYFPELDALDIVQDAANILTVGGFLIIGNVKNNLEHWFLERIVNWQMIYRTPKQLASLLLAANLNSTRCAVVYEPLEIHGIAMATKTR